MQRRNHTLAFASVVVLAGAGAAARPADLRRNAGRPGPLRRRLRPAGRAAVRRDHDRAPTAHHGPQRPQSAADVRPGGIRPRPLQRPGPSRGCPRTAASTPAPGGKATTSRPSRRSSSAPTARRSAASTCPSCRRTRTNPGASPCSWAWAARSSASGLPAVAHRAPLPHPPAHGPALGPVPPLHDRFSHRQCDRDAGPLPLVRALLPADGRMDAGQHPARPVRRRRAAQPQRPPRPRMLQCPADANGRSRKRSARTAVPTTHRRNRTGGRSSNRVIRCWRQSDQAV